jgi:anti-sigma-K factor RskA
MNEPDLHELVAAYALNALDDDEKAAFERHLATCERCAAELSALRETAASMAYTLEGPPPPPELRGRILDAVRAERANVIPLRRRGMGPALGAVAAIAAVIALGLGIWSASLSRSLDDERDRLAATEEALALVADPNASRTELAGAEGSLVVAGPGAAALVVCRLEEAPSGKAYEAWVIANGRPRPAGLFDGGDDCTAHVLSEPIPRGAIVAVTLEREEGVDAPTGDPLFTAKTA